MSTNTPWLRVSAACLACALASCGGGGDAGPAPAPPLQVSANGTAFTMQGLAPGVPTSNVLTFTLAGGQGSYYVGAATSGAAVVPQVDIVGETQVQVRLVPAGDLTQGGREQGQLTFSLCTDDQCAHVAWSKSYPYTYTQYQVDLSARAFTGTEAGGGTAQTLPVTPADTDHVLTVSGPSWLAASHDAQGNLVFTPSGVGLSAGSYAGTARVMLGQDAFTTQVIPVTLTLGGGLLAPAMADLVQQRDTRPADLAGTAPVAFAAGAERAWSATSDRTWLVIDTAGGTGTGAFSYHVDTVRAGRAITNFSSDTATVTLHANGLSDAVTTLTLRRQLPEIAMLTPGQVEPGQAATLTLTGRGLSQLQGVEQIQVGDAVPTGGTIVSDTQAVIQMGPHAAGSLQVGVSNLSQVRTAQANVAVTSAPRIYASVPAPGNDSKNAIVYDPSRHAVFAASSYGSTLQRFRLSSGGTWTLTAIPWSDIWRVQMSPDRRTLYVLAGDGLYEVDPDTLATRTKHAAPYGVSYVQGFYFDNALPLTNDLRLWLPGGGGQYFDIRRGAFLQAGWDEFQGVGAEDLTATPDGAHLYTLEGSFTPAPPDGWYSTATHTTTPLPAGVLQFYYRAAFDEKGTTGIFEGTQVYRTADWSLRGTIQAPAGETMNDGAQMSPDGTRAYVLSGTDYYGNADRVDVFDLTRLQPGTSHFVLLGEIPVPDPGTNCRGEYECDMQGRLAIDPLGKTLFWSGNAAFTVIPIPSSLSGLSGLSVPRAPAALRLAAPQAARQRAR